MKSPLPPPPTANPVAPEVYRRMLAGGFNYKSLSRAAGLGDTYVRDLLTGRSQNPKERELSKLAAALGCKIADLVHPGGTSSQPRRVEEVEEPDELALLDFWRSLTPIGRDRFIRSGIIAAPKKRPRKKRK